MLAKIASGLLKSSLASKGGALVKTSKSGKIGKVMTQRLKGKKQNIKSYKLLSKRRKENNLRIEKENLLELKKNLKKPKFKVPGKVKNFFQKVLEFIGVVFVGWLVDKLPKIIKMVENFTKRIKLIFSAISNLVKGIFTWVTGLVSLVLGIGLNLATFDFRDQSQRVNRALGKMSSAFDGLRGDLDNWSELNGDNASPVSTTPTENTTVIIPPSTSINNTSNEKQIQKLSTGGIVKGPSGNEKQIQKLSTGGIVKGPSGVDKIPAKLTAGESVLQVGARERQIKSTGIDPLLFNIGPNANKPSFEGLPGLGGGGGGTDSLTEQAKVKTFGSALGDFFSGDDGRSRRMTDLERSQRLNMGGVVTGSGAINNVSGSIANGKNQQQPVIIIEEDDVPLNNSSTSGGSPPIILNMGNGSSLNNIMQKQFLLDLAYT